MREVLAEIEAWRKAGKSVAIATNVCKEGASLRSLGAKMAMTTDGEIAGSVTGGCIEGAVYEAAQAVIESGAPKLLHYGATGEEALWDIGLSCGGSLDVLVESLDAPGWRAIYPALRDCLAQNQLAALGTVISEAGRGSKMLVWPDGRSLGSLGSAALDEQALGWLAERMDAQEAGWTSFRVAAHHVEQAACAPAVFAGVDVFADVFTPLSRMIVIGAVHIAAPLVTLAKALGYYTIVIDPRKAFATRERFPHVDELIVEWPSDALERLRPDEGTYVAALSHDEKLDNPALAVALKSPARYVGVLGTRKNIGKRLDALRELGVPEQQLGRLHAPIGMSLGAVSPEEIALSILAEMVSARHGPSKTQAEHTRAPTHVLSRV